MKLLCIASLIAATMLTAQERRIDIPPRPTCATCSIELVKVATVGNVADPFLLGELSRVARGPGNTFVAGSLVGSEFLVYVYHANACPTTRSTPQPPAASSDTEH